MTKETEVKVNKRAKDTYAKQSGISRKRKIKNHGANGSFVGAPLINRLWTRMTELGETPPLLAKKLGISYSYLMLLAKGERDISGLRVDQLREIANYLRIPVASAATLGGFFQPRDFFLEATLEERVEMAYDQLKLDPLVGSFAVPNEVWCSLPQEIKFLVAVLYENGGSKKLLDHATLYRIEHKH